MSKLTKSSSDLNGLGWVVAFIIALPLIVALSTLGGWVLMLAFGIIHLHIASGVPAIGFWVAWPLSVLYSVFTYKGTSKKEQ